MGGVGQAVADAPTPDRLAVGRRMKQYGRRRYRVIDFGVDRLAGMDVPRHIHRGGYANVVLAGGFTEVAFAGRSTVEPGVALLHGPFDCHANTGLARRGATIIRLPWSGRAEGAHRVRDPDLLARLCERDIVEAE